MSSAASAAFRPLKNAITKAVNASKHAGKPSQAKQTPSQTASHASTRESPAPPGSQPLFAYTYEPIAKPMNITTFQTTRLNATDPSCPFYIKLRRRMAAFDNNTLVWRVHVPLVVSKRATVRRWAIKRVREAINKELKARGFHRDGSLINGEGADGSRGLRGALLVKLPNDSEKALRTKYEEVEIYARWLIGQIMDRQSRGKMVNPGHGFRSPLRNLPKHPSSNTEAIASSGSL